MLIQFIVQILVEKQHNLCENIFAGVHMKAPLKNGQFKDRKKSLILNCTYEKTTPFGLQQ